MCVCQRTASAQSACARLNALGPSTASEPDLPQRATPDPPPTSTTASEPGRLTALLRHSSPPRTLYCYTIRHTRSRFQLFTRRTALRIDKAHELHHRPRPSPRVHLLTGRLQPLCHRANNQQIHSTSPALSAPLADQHLLPSSPHIHAAGRPTRAEARVSSFTAGTEGGKARTLMTHTDVHAAASVHSC